MFKTQAISLRILHLILLVNYFVILIDFLSNFNLAETEICTCQGC
jgi:hypothetical protein